MSDKQEEWFSARGQAAPETDVMVVFKDGEDLYAGWRTNDKEYPYVFIEDTLTYDPKDNSVTTNAWAKGHPLLWRPLYVEPTLPESVVKKLKEYDELEKECDESAARIVELNIRANALKNGNTALLSALMDFVNQFFLSYNKDGTLDEDGEFLQHGHTSAEEYAVEVLTAAGMMEFVPGRGYKLLYDKLAEREPKQQTWEEAVNECISDPVEKERLLKLADDKPSE